MGNKFAYDGVPGTHQWYDGTPHPWEFKRVWHLEPSLTDPDTVYAGVEDAALFRSTDGGANWEELSGLRGHGTGPHWQPGAGGMCLHTIMLDPANPRADLHRHLGGGRLPHRRRRRDLEADQQGAGLEVHSRSRRPRSATACITSPCTARGRDVLFMQKHWDVMRTDDAGDNWHEVSGNLPTDFGFAIDVHAHEPETIYVVPIKSDSEHFPLEGKLRVYRSRTGGNEWEPLTKGLPQKDCYVNVLRDAMAVDSLDECGVYFGTTGGQVYASADAGDNWTPIVQRSAGGAVASRCRRCNDPRGLCRSTCAPCAGLGAGTCAEVALEVAAPVTVRRSAGRAGSAATRCCAGRFASMERESGAHSCVFLPARKTCRMRGWMPSCRPRWRRGANRC